jgi:flavin reductase (DIM6/NTAB) family NADH-FMN oxidoreductase RutF
MKKNLGPVNALYPMPTILVGTEVDGKINYITIAHVGIIDMNTLSISISKSHFSNQGIKKNQTLSINFPTVDMVVETDYVGLVSGANTDKSKIFDSFYGILKGAPMIKNAPLVMECEVVKILDMPNYDVFLVKPISTYCDEEVMTGGQIDFAKINPILFDMPLRKYWSLGEPIADSWAVGKSYHQQNT